MAANPIQCLCGVRRLRLDRLRFVGQRLDCGGFGQKQAFRIVDGDCEVQILPTLQIHGRDSNYFSRHVEQWAATATRGDGRRDLQEFAAFFLDCSDSANYAV